MEIKTQRIFMLPFILKGNSYIELLRKGIESIPEEFDGMNVEILPFSYRGYMGAAFRGERPVAHIHMETNVYGSTYVLASVLRMVVRFSLFFFARACGARIVWTLHNLSAHDYPHPLLDALGRAIMWQIADVVIVQNQNILPSLRHQHPHVRIVYIPHGNYIDAYGPRMSRSQARSSLGIPEDACVMLSLGAIRPYKRIEAMIDAVHLAAQKSESGILLLIAGKGESSYIQTLTERAQGSSAIKILGGFVEDARIPVFLGAADYSLLAHADSSLTSGALMLALSYDVPVITENMPAAELISEGVNGFVVSDDAALGALISRYKDLPHPAAGAAVASVADFTWERVGKETRAVYAFCRETGIVSNNSSDTSSNSNL